MASVMSGTAGDRVLSVDLDRVTEITRKPDFVDVLVFADSSLGLGKTRKGRVISPEEEFGELCSSLGLVLKTLNIQFGAKTNNLADNIIDQVCEIKRYPP